MTTTQQTEAFYKVTNGRATFTAPNGTEARAMIERFARMGEWAWAVRTDGRELSEFEARFLEVAR